MLRAPEAYGATYSWIGGADSNWATAGNWYGSLAPAAIPTWSSPAVPQAPFGLTNNLSFSVVDSLTFNSNLGGALSAAGSTMTVGAGGINDSSSYNVTLGMNLSGVGGVTVNAPGTTLLLAGSNSFTGTVTVGAGTLQIGNGTTDSTLAGNPFNINSPGSLVFAPSAGTTLNTNINGTGGVAIIGPGPINFGFSGGNSYSGGTTLAAAR